MIVKDDNHAVDIRLLLEVLSPEMKRTGVIHIGAHLGEEVSAYLEFGFKKIILVEANPDCCQKMKEIFKSDPRVQIFNYAITDHNGPVNLLIHTSRSGSKEPASLLPMKKLKEIVNSISTVDQIEVEGVTLDTFLEKNQIEASNLSLMNIDIQGAELKALAGAPNLLSLLDAVICEVALIELYEGAALEVDIVAHLSNQGFEKSKSIYHTLYDEKGTFPAWGECLFQRRGEISS